jgi:hypothetical protein
MDDGEIPDILLGLDNIHVHKTQECRSGRPWEPYAELTALGWVVRGKVGRKTGPRKAVTMVSCHAEFTLPKQVEEFFGNETYGTEYKPVRTLSKEDQEVWDEIQTGIEKLPDEPGYTVKLPWRKDVAEPLDNRKQAEKRLMSTFRRLQKVGNEREKLAYEKAMQKYLDDGYARVVYKYDPEELNEEVREGGQYFLPHHGVWKKDKKSLRLVFDSAAEAADGLSLNDHLYNGPKLQSELPAVLLRFREEDVAFVADVEAMFSRIRLTTEDARKHRLLWKVPGDNPRLITVLEMTRVVFGDGPSPCLAIATLQRAAQDFGGEDPEATDTILNGMYVDDLLDSTRTLQEANQRATQVSTILEQGDFHLRSWQSNHPQFKRMEEMQGTTKILGMPWEVEKDLILHAVPEEKDLNQRSLTKRGLLRLVASIFSPLGLATPMVVKAKIRIGRLHSMGLGWDEDLELRVQTATTQKARQAYQEEVDFWRKWIDLVPAMCSTPFPRCIRPRGGEVIRTELHMFGDASEEAFAAAVYIRNIYLDGEITMTVVMAKSRLGPKKVISVAKMELQAALLGTRLARTVEGALRFKVDRRIFWTDSAVTRHWIRSTANFYKSFVACRVGEIQALTQPTEWRHIPGKLNVADLATRSAITEENEENPLPREWIEGKDFLHQTDESAWPKDLDFEHTGEEVRPNWEFMTMHAKTTFAEDLVDLTKVSRYLHLQRVIARVVAVFQKKKLTAMLERPNRECLQLAEKVLVRDAQKEFIEEMESYRNEKKIKRS